MDKGIELSINFLVMFVLSITVFGLGVAFIYNLFGDATDLTNLTQEEIDSQLQDITCDAGDKVCLTNNHQKVYRGEDILIGIYVYNYFREPVSVEMNIDTPPEAYDTSGNVISTEFYPRLVGSTDRIERVLPGRQAKTGVIVAVDEHTPSGEYAFTTRVRMLDGDTEVDNLLRKIYVTVP